MYSADCPKCKYFTSIRDRDLVRNNDDKVLEKRQVDEDSESDDVDIEEDFDPVINKGFCKSIYPLVVKLFVSRQIKFPFYIKHQKKTIKTIILHRPTL